MARRVLQREQEPDPDGSFDQLLGYNIRRLSVLVMADLTETLAPLALKPADAMILLTIGEKPGITQSEIGRILGIQRANMAPLLAGLLQAQLVEKAAADGRSQELRLSAAGQARRRAAWQAMLAHEQRIFGALAPPARTRMARQVRELWMSVRAM